MDEGNRILQDIGIEHLAGALKSRSCFWSFVSYPGGSTANMADQLARNRKPWWPHPHILTCTHLNTWARGGDGVEQQKGKQALQGLGNLRRTQSAFAGQIITPLCP